MNRRDRIRKQILAVLATGAVLLGCGAAARPATAAAPNVWTTAHVFSQTNARDHWATRPNRFGDFVITSLLPNGLVSFVIDRDWSTTLIAPPVGMQYFVTHLDNHGYISGARLNLAVGQYAAILGFSTFEPGGQMDGVENARAVFRTTGGHPDSNSMVTQVSDTGQVAIVECWDRYFKGHSVYFWDPRHDVERWLDVDFVATGVNEDMAVGSIQLPGDLSPRPVIYRFSQDKAGDFNVERQLLPLTAGFVGGGINQSTRGEFIGYQKDSTGRCVASKWNANLQPVLVLPPTPYENQQFKAKLSRDEILITNGYDKQGRPTRPWLYDPFTGLWMDPSVFFGELGLTEVEVKGVNQADEATVRARRIIDGAPVVALVRKDEPEGHRLLLQVLKPELLDFAADGKFQGYVRQPAVQRAADGTIQSIKLLEPVKPDTGHVYVLRVVFEGIDRSATHNQHGAKVLLSTQDSTGSLLRADPSNPNFDYTDPRKPGNLATLIPSLRDPGSPNQGLLAIQQFGREETRGVLLWNIYALPAGGRLQLTLAADCSDGHAHETAKLELVGR
jgi:hypothetical protein